MDQPTFLIKTLGCRVNQRESQLISRDLLQAGWKKSQNNPNLVILNSCVVTRKAQQKVRKVIRQLGRKYPQAQLTVIGCAVNAQKKLNIKLPEADFYFTNRQKQNLAAKLNKVTNHKIDKPQNTSLYNKEQNRVFIKIQSGCQQFCTYCIVPFLRPRPHSHRPEQIITTINNLPDHIREVILCGINLADYGKNQGQAVNLAELIKQILAQTDIPRLSLSSLTPSLIEDELINLFIADWQGNRRLSQYFHLALQSASPAILQKMNRPPVDLKKLSQQLTRIRQAIPIFTLRADIIVGFPGETEANFNQTKQFIKNNRISFGHVFRFSPRPQTVAAQKQSQTNWEKVDPLIKQQRSNAIRQIIKEIRREEAQKLISRKIPTLILHYDNKNVGLAANYWPVQLKKQPQQKGKIVPVQLTDFQNDQLIGAVKE